MKFLTYPNRRNSMHDLKIWIIYLTIQILYIISMVKAAECPAQELILPCKCLTREDEYQIWCSHSELVHVMDGLKAIGKLITSPIDELILENNNLPSLPAQFFLQVRILRLMLRNNYLQRVSSGWLNGLENTLMELYIVEPELRGLPIDSLDRLRQLEAVTIKSMLMKRVPNFSGLPKLRYIHIESLSLMELSPRNFRRLSSLEKLHITGSDHLARLEANVLQDLPRLNLVNMSYNAINWIHPRALARLPNLIEFDLIGNQITDAGMVGRGIRDLQALSTLRLDYNYIDKIGEASFVDIPSLKDLYLSYNEITEIHHGAFHRVPMLRTLELNYNLVHHVHPESFLQHSGSGLEELWLINNNINHVSELRSLLDALPRLIFLDMSYNHLEDIPFGSLRGHPTLERLHLNHNKIEIIEREAFIAMPALRELRLKNNSLSNLLDGPLWNLPALKGLDLSQNYFKRLEPRLLTNLPSLRRIDLSENQITLVDPATFLETPHLEHLNISHNMLSTIHPATFRHLMNLYEVDVSHNRLIEFIPGLPRGIEYLHLSRNQILNFPLPPSPDLDLPSLRMLDISRNAISKIIPGSLRTMPQLRRLNLGRNVLQSLENGCFDGLDRLEMLDLRENRLMLLHPQCLENKRELREINLKGNHLEMLVPEIFQDTHHLKKVDISDNRLTEIMAGTFQNIKELKMFDVSYNSLTQLPTSIRNLKNLEILDLTNNRIRYLQPETLSSLVSLAELKISRNLLEELRPRAFDNLPNLSVLDLQENQIENAESLAINQLPNLTVLKLSKNKLKTLPDSVFHDLPSLHTAELQENRLKSIADTAFNNVPHLLYLNLSMNHLSNLDQSGLRGIRSLEVLDLSNNKLTRIENSQINKMEWLVELKLDNNQICTIKGTPFNGMSRLRVLSLRNNQLFYLPEHTVKRLRNNIILLDIEGNPIVCDCSMLWMKGWLEEMSELGPRCADGQYLRQIRISKHECINYSIKRQPMLNPTCSESEILDSNTYGTSPILSPYMTIKGNTSNVQINQQIAPSPEESEYFYDEYVDYPYNESLTIDQNNTLFDGQFTQIPTTIISATTEKASSHFISGDTPTIYAEPKKNSSYPQINNVSSKLPSPGTSGFTFFGVPLPTLNLGSLWGSSRKSDRKSSTSSRGNGRVHMYPELYNNPSANPADFPPSRPDVQSGGFIPMLPGSGGFVPILPPTDKNDLQNQNTTKEKDGVESEMNLYKNKDDFINTENIDNSDESKLTKRGPHYSESSSTKIEDSAKETKITQKPRNKVTITKLNHKPNVRNVTQPLNTTITTTIGNSTTEMSPKNVLAFPSTSTPSTSAMTSLKSLTTDMYEEFHTNSSLDTETKSNISVDIPSIDTSTISIHQNDDNSHFSNNNFNKEISEDSPSSLSALLIPGGQYPQQYKPPAGKSTITKVESPHLRNMTTITTTKQPSNEQFFLDVSENESQFHHSNETKTEPQSYNDDSSMSWYFKNYNLSNLEPYIGPGQETHFVYTSVASKGASSFYCKIFSIHFLLISYYNLYYVKSAIVN